MTGAAGERRTGTDRSRSPKETAVANIRRRLRGLAQRPASRRLLDAAHHELGLALDDVYGGRYFGEGRNPRDREDRSGYERYDRQTSNADVAAYLAWLAFPAATALDVGCATGFVVEALRELDIDASGIDVSAYAISHAAAGARGHVRQGDVRRGLPFASRSFDLVTTLETLEHLDPADVPAAVAEIARVSRQWVLCTIPSFGPNPNGPGGWYQVKVRDDRVAYYEGLGPSYEGPIPFGDLYRDADGLPIEGHLTMASFSWWTDRFADAGLVRCGTTERRLHPEMARMGLTKYWNLYVFRRPEAPEPDLSARTAAAAETVLSRFRLMDRVADPADLDTIARTIGPNN